MAGLTPDNQKTTKLYEGLIFFINQLLGFLIQRVLFDFFPMMKHINE